MSFKYSRSLKIISLFNIFEKYENIKKFEVENGHKSKNCSKGTL